MSDYKLRIVACAYRPGLMLYQYLWNFYMQTRKDDVKLTIYHDGPEILPAGENNTTAGIVEVMKRHFKPGQLEYTETPERLHNPETREGWGHGQKDLAIKDTEEEYIKFDNVDNLTVPRGIELALKYVEEYNLDFAYWDLLHSYANCNPWPHPEYNVLISSPTINRIDVCNFIVKTEVAKKTGWNHRGTGADGYFVMECLDWNKGLNVMKIPSILSIHN